MERNDDVVGGLVESQKLIEFLVNELRALAVNVADIKNNINSMKKDVDTLMKLVRDGNGVPPLLRRVDKLEERQKIALENVRGKWALAAASVAGFLGMIVALVALFK